VTNGHFPASSAAVPDEAPTTRSRPRKARRWFRRLIRWLGWVAVLLGVAALVWGSGALYRRFVRFPREERAWAALRLERQPVTESGGWTQYRGILHSHSLLSHDSEVPFEEILRVLQATGIDFICLSDHCTDSRADFSRQWRGLHDGKLFVPGFEMKEGMMPFGVAAGAVLSNRADSTALARQILAQGGVLFYAHPEETRAWDRPELTGMEIYNLHTDFKAERRGLLALLPDVLINLRRYPDHVVRLVFHRPTAFLQRWDDLNRTRHLTGIAANDCHQNVGLRAVCSATNTVRLEDTGRRTLGEFRLNWLNRPLLRLGFGPLEPGRQLFRVQLDPYERSARFVNTHVLARELTEAALLDALRAGRVFVGFDSMVDSSGFLWLAEDKAGRATMGEALGFTPETRLRAESPVPCRFTVIKDGSPVHQAVGRRLDWRPPGPGKYRVEAEVGVLGEWVPWVYANPIELR
jgi:hypothetical protein